MTENEGLWSVCETCGAVPTRHNDYKDCEKYLQVVMRAYNAGRERERADVVEWLTERGYYVADAYVGSIERGEHRREEKPGAIMDVPRACE